MLLSSVSEREKLGTPPWFLVTPVPLWTLPVLPNSLLLHSPSLPPSGNSFLGVINVPLSQNPVTRETIPGNRLGLIEMQPQSPGPALRAAASRVGSFWQLWSILYQVGHSNYVFLAFIVCQFNCHGFIVVFLIFIFFPDHSAKEGN